MLNILKQFISNLWTDLTEQFTTQPKSCRISDPRTSLARVATHQRGVIDPVLDHAPGETREHGSQNAALDHLGPQGVDLK